MNTKSPLSIVADEMDAVNQLIITRLKSDVVLINEMGKYIVNSGGKRLRPALVLLASGACQNMDERAYTVSAIIEFIHTATLLHDDVVDESTLRRGRETANVLWGNEASVLVGDFLYSRSFEMMVDVGDMRVMQILAQTTNTIAEGEVMQLLNIKDAETTEQRYLEVIHSKTAKLFEAACQLGAVLAQRPATEETALANYGMHLGTAFQLIDDVLDYTAEEKELGKDIGNDLAEGKPTLPLIHAMRTGSASQAKTVERAIEEGDVSLLDDVLEILRDCGSLEYTQETAVKESELAVQALQQLPESDYRAAMIDLAGLSIQRSH